MKKVLTVVFSLAFYTSCSNLQVNTLPNENVPVTTQDTLETAVSKINTKEFKTNSPKQNLKTLMPVFEFISKEANVSKNIVMCFWAQETGWGKSTAFAKGFNFGGIMINSKVVKYSSLLEGAKAYARVLGHNRYTKALPKSIEEQDKKPFRELLTAYHSGGYWGSDTKEITIRETILKSIAKLI